MLFYLEHAIQDASLHAPGERRVVSKRMLYVELDADGTTRHVQYAPYLDYRPLAGDEPDVERDPRRGPSAPGSRGELEQQAQGYAIAHVVPEHLAEVRGPKLALIDKTEAAVKDRLTKEITYWDHRAEQLKLQEQAGKPNARLNSGEARKRADVLQARLQKRLDELKLEAQISPLPPVVLGGLLVVPIGLLAQMTGTDVNGADRADRHAGQRRAGARHHHGGRAPLGFEPTDREFEKLGYDIESRVPGTGQAALHRGQGPRRRRPTPSPSRERDPLLAQQARGLHPGASSSFATTTRIASTTCASRSSASRTSA